VLAQVLRGELDVGFHLDTDGDDAAAPAPLAARTLTRFTYRVVAPAGWGPQVLGRDWKALAALPWLATPPESAHHRLLDKVFGPLGLSPRRAALVDQEASMLDLLKSGVGLSLLRDSIAIRESQSHGLVLADRVQLDCALRFVSLAARRNEPVIACAWNALARAWH
jgi:DNA-binding transcriptional LysR family regulator